MSGRWAAVRRQAALIRAGVESTGLTGRDLIMTAIADRGLTVLPLPPDASELRGARGVWDGDFILIDDSLPLTHQVWVLAHELGHAVLHTDHVGCDDIDVVDQPVEAPLLYGAGRVDTYNPKLLQELAANVFAAAFLLPLDDVRARFLAGKDFRSIAVTAGVSEGAALHALVQALLNLPVPEEPDRLVMSSPPLDPTQRLAAEIEAGPVLVNAGPGTGKTRTLIARVQHLLTQRESSASILAVTFSNRAAAEMRERIQLAEPERAADITVSTFHGFCLEILRRYHELVGLPSDFTVIDEVDAVALLQRNMPRLPLDDHRLFGHPGAALRDVVGAIGEAKDELAGPETYASLVDEAAKLMPAGDDHLVRWGELARVYAVYEELLRELGVVDYGGLVFTTETLLREHPNILADLRREYRHILVDEYQDMNRASAQLLRLLAGDAWGLWVVGDLRQSIYRFRGASPANITAFHEDFPGGETLHLGVNYRSDPAIVELIGHAAGLVPNAGGPQRWDAHRSASDGPRVTMAVAPDPTSQAAGIAEEIAQRMTAGVPACDHAVLVRTHNQALEVSDELERAGISTLYVGKLFARPEIRSLLSLMSLAVEGNGAGLMLVGNLPEYPMPRGDRIRLIRHARETRTLFPEALRLAPEAGLLDPVSITSAARLHADLSRVGFRVSPWAFLARFLFGGSPILRRLHDEGASSGFRGMLAIGQLLAIAKAFADRPLVQGPGQGDVLPAFLTFVREIVADDGHVGTQPEGAEALDAVRVMTVHAAKGLEFPVVFVPNLCAKRFPFQGPSRGIPPVPGLLSSPAGRDDDALFFVAISRARDKVVLSRPETTGRNRRPAVGSAFLEVLDALPADAVNRLDWPQVSRGVQTELNRPHRRDTAIKYRDLEQYVVCPRRFEFHRVLELRQRELEMPYEVFRRVAFEALHWARLQYSLGCRPSAEEVVGQMTAAWGKDDDREPLMSSSYARATRGVALTIADLLGSDDVVETLDADLIHHIVPGIPLNVGLDVVLRHADGRIQATRARLYPPGGKGAQDDERNEITLAVTRRVLTERFSSVVSIEMEIRYLLTGDHVELPMSKRYEPARIEKVRTAMSAIAAGQFPANPDRHCRTCPFWTICPA